MAEISSQVEAPSLLPSTLESETTTPDPVPTTLTSETTETSATLTSTISTTTSSNGGLALSTSSSSSSSRTRLPSSTSSGTSSPSAAASPSASATQSSNPAQLSGGSIAGIAVGSVVALILVLAILLFAFGFRVRRGQWRDHTKATHPIGEQGMAAAGSSQDGGQRGKAELEDSEYTRRLERLQDGAKPELEESWLRKVGRRAFSLRSARGQPRPAPAELGTEPVTPGPYELPAGNSVPSGNDGSAQCLTGQP